MKKQVSAGLLLASILLCAVGSYSQGLYKVAMEEKISRASLIIEGKVSSQTSSWNDKHSMIFTTSQVDVYKVFKGETNKTSIEIVTVGGAVGGIYYEASHQLKLNVNDMGVFFCQPSKTLTVSSVKAFDVYSSMQGFLKYDPSNETANAPFAENKSVIKDLYKELRKKTGKLIELKKPPRPETVPASQDHDYRNATMAVQAPIITSFSPSTVTAGTYLNPANNILTITGSGFGSTPGGSAAVLFDDADNALNSTPATYAYSLPYFISWTDTEIKIRVPTQAGTGLFSVRDNSGNLAVSPTNLTVTYSVFGPMLMGVIKEMNLVDWDGLGGYTLFYSSNTANSGVNLNTHAAKATFQRALTTWKEGVGLNFTEGGATTTQTVNGGDDINTVMFDNAATGLPPMPAGVLATCYSYSGMCTDDLVNNQLVKVGFDIVIRNSGYSAGSTAFTLGPCPPLSNSFTEVDLESVLLHELGHAANLGHIYDPPQNGPVGNRNPNKVMHFSTSTTFKRTSLDYAALVGAAYSVTPQGNQYGACAAGLLEMAPLATIVEPKDECPASFPLTNTPEFTTVSFDLAHATSNKFVDPYYTQLSTDGSGIPVTNTAYYALRTNNSGVLALEVSGYSTIPAAQAACTPFDPAIPVTGVRVSLYQLNNCPGGGAFPTPLATTRFQGDGVLPVVSGLMANTTYLLVANGVENTKAVFNIIFSGSVLPLRIIEFSGRVMPDHNLIWWTTDFSENLRNLELERSGDGIQFMPVYKIDNIALQKKGSYADKQPLQGNNYYRLKAINPDGSTQYSKVTLLNRKAAFAVNVFPNPAMTTISLDIRDENPGRFTAILRNAIGQTVIEKSFFVNSGAHMEKLQVSQQARGIYHLTILRENKQVTSTTIQLK